MRVVASLQVEVVHVVVVDRLFTNVQGVKRIRKKKEMRGKILARIDNSVKNACLTGTYRFMGLIKEGAKRFHKLLMMTKC